jgi:hypothetical protein
MTVPPVAPGHLAHARKVADTILYEGYLLYPYRKSAQKNQARFQFGVLMPPAYHAVDPYEPSASQAECLLECGDTASLWILVRFLHLRRRTVQAPHPVTGELGEVATLLVDGHEYCPWEEAIDREHEVSLPVTSVLAGDAEFPVHFGAGEDSEDLTSAGREWRGEGRRVVGRLTHRWDALDAVITVRAERLPGPYGVLRLRVSLQNRTVPPGPVSSRADGLRHALISAHTLIGADGTFLSMTDPPEWAAPMAAECTNTGVWPVLAGPADCGNLMMASPIILYDHPEIAPESAGNLFDATEIDEILTLRTLAMTDDEKAEARSTDPRAAGLLDRLDGLPPEMLEKMHGAIRYLAPAGAPPNAEEPSTPWWDPGADTSVSPQTDHVMVRGVRLARGSRVTMRPGLRQAGSRRADAQDLFLAGREAVVEAVLFDVDGQVHLAVIPDGDPELAELQRSHGRFLYFSPDEIEPASSSHKEERS